jgi:hypothetical protein
MVDLMELYWWTVEVLDSPAEPARAWRDAYGHALTEAAITNGAYDWRWQAHTWGVLFEIAFASDARWEVFRDLPAVRAALDATPDPVNGLLVYPGRGGSSGRVQPRRPKPVAGAGAAPIPVEEPPPVTATGRTELSGDGPPAFQTAA